MKQSGEDSEGSVIIFGGRAGANGGRPSDVQILLTLPLVKHIFA